MKRRELHDAGSTPYQLLDMRQTFPRLHLDRLRPLIGIGGAAVVSFAILAVTLHPFEWVPPQTHNGAAYDIGGGIEFQDTGIARAAAPPWLARAIKTNQLEIELAVDAASDRQGGPARILTISQNTHRRNLTIGQEGRDLVVRLRTPSTDGNGLPPVTIADVFGQSGWVDIHMNIELERLTIWVDNELRLDEQLPQAALKTWDASYWLALGNELTGDRAWRGRIGRAVVTVSGESIDYALPGALEVPDRFWFFHRDFNFAPLTETSWSDCLGNFLLFVPLGFVLALAVRRHHWWRNVQVIAFASSFSTIIEALQLGLPGRYPSLNDILFNTGGSVLGLVLARWLICNARTATLFKLFTCN